MNQPKQTVLVVDDEETIRMILVRILEREGFSIIEANNGLEALERMQESQAEFVISDIQMPEMDGFELLVALKDRYPATKVLMITGYGHEFTPERLVAAGADYYITKPFRSIDISNTLRLMSAGMRLPAVDSIKL